MSKKKTNSSYLDFDDFDKFDFLDEDKPKKKKKKKKSKKKKYKVKNNKKKSTFDRVLDSARVDTKININITDETIDRVLDTGINLVNTFLNRKGIQPPVVAKIDHPKDTVENSSPKEK